MSRACRCAIPQRLAFVTQTTLSVDDTAAIVEALRAALSGAAGAAQGRHLLRHAESPGCGQAAARAMRRADRGGLAQQLQFQSPARAGRPRRRARLSGRWRRAICSANGSTATKRSASPPAHRRPSSWCRKWSSDCATGAARRRPSRTGEPEHVVFALPARAAVKGVAMASDETGHHPERARGACRRSEYRRRACRHCGIRVTAQRLQIAELLLGGAAAPVGGADRRGAAPAAASRCPRPRSTTP